MNNDLVKRLREKPGKYICGQAADEIERLTEMKDEFRKAATNAGNDCAKAVKERDQLRALLREQNEYLSENKFNSIGSGSPLHQKIAELLEGSNDE